MEIYKAPKSELKNSGRDSFRPNRLWKVFFWLNVVLIILLILVLFSEGNMTIFDYFDASMFLISVVGLYGYVYQRRLGNVKLWRIFCFVYPLWYFFYIVVVGFILKISQYGLSLIHI